MKHSTIIAAIMFAACTETSAFQPEPITPNVVQATLANVKYGSDTRQRMDVYVPAAQGPVAVVVCVHGGSWRSGSEDSGHCADARSGLNGSGYAVVLPTYRFAPGNQSPDQQNDVASAVQMVRDSAVVWGIDASSIVCGGVSAGAQLALLQNCDAKFGFSAPTDLTGAIPLSPPAQNVANNYLGGGDPVSASPLYGVSGSSPPHFMCWNRNDQIVDPQHSIQMHAALEANGVASDTASVSAQDHTFPLSMCPAFFGWLANVVNGPPQPTPPPPPPVETLTLLPDSVTLEVAFAGSPTLIGFRQGPSGSYPPAVSNGQVACAPLFNPTSVAQRTCLAGAGTVYAVLEGDGPERAIGPVNIP